MAITRPVNLTKPFADSAGVGYVRTIPEASQISITPGAASLTDGFPPLNFLDPTAGGVPPSGQDMNGILKILSEHTAFQGSGGCYRFDSALSTAIGGYPVGAVLQDNLGLTAYVNSLAGNTTDFNTTPASIGVSWHPWAGAGLNKAVHQIMIVNETQPSGTDGGDSTVAANIVRTLNTVDHNSIVGASLASNTITLPAGTYKVFGKIPTHGIQRAKAYFANVTDGGSVVMGTAVDSLDQSATQPGGNLSENSELHGTFTITGTKNFQVKMSSDTAATNGLGVAASVGALEEIYTVVEITKIA